MLTLAHQEWTHASLSRRRLLQGASALMIAVGGKMLWPHQARSEAAPLDPFSVEEAALVERLGDVLAIGAGQAGLAHFLAAQLRKAHADSLLILRYLDIPPPYLDFYRAGLKAVADSAMTAHGQPFADLDQEAALAFVRTLMTGNPPGWTAALPAPLFMFVLRADAVDVNYGTPAGFARLKVPYMAHIDPDPVW